MPQIFSKISADNFQILVWKIEEPFAFFETFPASWSTPTIENPIKKLESIAARYCLHQLSPEFESLVLVQNDRNRPYFQNSEWHISLTHSYPYVAAACSPEKRIGIDLEKPGRNIEKIAPRFLCPAELAKWKDTSNLLTLAWSAKESIYKAVGKPGLSFQKEMEIFDFNQNPCKAQISTKEEIAIYWEEFPEFSLTVALI
ncbi:4'-phosphopantetheinyl transferase family protein [Aquirufa antheringensis]|jgi:4'-phosphopantetheinyl transferase|uniref:4'-phosphopantetheinyl transferase family protein n=1 Tax=Aquirufa antheringensis TaxID=2516559 RepID=UPI00208FE3BD|nr:4'-phosphopantetheinyl transferase superfamily protein [Aquirufa antheringensis]USQ04316.1 4'-phosphopantetheinyl transferase superfamily protein [Aquirufa antheringensis]